MAVPKTMRALVAYGKGDYRLEQNWPVPVPGKDEYLIRVEACGICASDMKCYHGAAMFWGDEMQPGCITTPVVPGHEFVGEIVAVGEGTESEEFSVGDRVASDQIVPCWDCKFCKSGRYWMCQKHDIYGFQPNVSGGMGEYMLLPKGALIYHVPKDIPIESAVLIEPFACSKHAVDRAQIGNEDIVVISGAGTLGLGMIGCAHLRNPKKLISLDLNPHRLELARQFGADLALNPAKDPVREIIMDLTDGYGCDIYIEATGAPKSVTQGLELIRRLGRFVEFSVFGAPTTVDWSIIGDRKELDLLGSHLGPYCYPPVIDWIGSGKLPTKGVVTHMLPLEKYEEGFELASNGNESIKVVLIP